MRPQRLVMPVEAIDEAESEDSTFEVSMAKLWSLPDGAGFQRALAIDCYREEVLALAEEQEKRGRPKTLVR